MARQRRLQVEEGRRAPAGLLAEGRGGRARPGDGRTAPRSRVGDAGENRGAAEIEGRRRSGQGRCTGVLDRETQEREARIGEAAAVGGRPPAR
jgi:hypothetical protein